MRFLSACLTFCILVFCCGKSRADDQTLSYEVICLEKDVDFCGQLLVTAQLTNDGKAPVKVFWGNAAYCNMFRFNITQVDSKQTIEVRSTIKAPGEDPPTAATEKLFRTIQPGGNIQYRISLGTIPGAGRQYAFFRRPGKIRIAPSLNIVADEIVDPVTGKRIPFPEAWTGQLNAKPFEITVNAHTDGFRGVNVRGVVRDPNGQPAQDVLVRFTASNIRQFQPLGIIDTVRTDRNGQFELFNAPAESRQVIVATFHPDYASDVQLLDRFEINQDIRLDLPTSVLVKGQVVNHLGESVSNARVNSKVLTDKDGRFSMMGVADEKQHELYVWHEDYESKQQAVSAKAATSGDLKIVLYDKQSLTVIGRARFADGRLISRANVSIQLNPLDPKSANDPGEKNVHCRTDDRGEFRLVLPDAIAYSADVHVWRETAGEWHTRVDRVAPGKNIGYLLLDNQRSITAKIKYASTIPESCTRVLRISVGKSGRLAKEVVVAKGQTEITVGGLSPNTYKVELTIQGTDYRQQHAVEIPIGEDENAAVVDFDVPKRSFGGAEIKILLPDGETPAASTAFWVSSSGNNFTANTDSKGVLNLKDVQSGPISLSISRVEGISPRAAHYKIPRDQIADWGTLRLRRIEEDFGWFKGKLVDRSGKAVFGHVTGQYAGANLTMWSDGFIHDRDAKASGFGGPGQPTTAKSEFNVQAPIGKKEIVFGFGRSTISSGAWHMGNQEALVVPVEIKAGETINRDIVVPPLVVATAQLDYHGSDNVSVHVIVELDNQMRWEKPITRLDRKVYLPAGKCHFLLRDRDYLACQTIDLTKQKEAVVDFNNKPGSLAVSLNQGDHAVEDFGFTVLAKNDQRTFLLSHSEGAEFPSNHALLKRSQGLTTVTGLAPGEYLIQINKGEFKAIKPASIVTGKETKLEFELKLEK